MNAGGSVTNEDLQRVLALYDLAEKRVLPELPIPPDSRSAVMQREVLRSGRVAITGVVRRTDQTMSGPDRSGPASPGRGLDGI